MPIENDVEVVVSLSKNFSKPKDYVEWCRQNGIDNVYIWPDGETPKRIYEEGGYRVVRVRRAGRAVIREKRL